LGRVEQEFDRKKKKTGRGKRWVPEKKKTSDGREGENSQKRSRVS